MSTRYFFVIRQSFSSRRNTFRGDDFGLVCDEKKKFLHFFVISQSFSSRRNTFRGDDFGLVCDEKKKFLYFFVIRQSFSSRRNTLHRKKILNPPMEYVYMCKYVTDKTGTQHISPRSSRIFFSPIMFLSQFQFKCKGVYNDIEKRI
jgi:hypothetical protein